jgi:hypothetical protein
MQLFAQSPHGEALKIDCAQCHNPESWSIAMETIKFNHTKLTEFELEGTHSEINCKECHSTLVFNEAKTDCVSCHTDMHSGSVGNDCVRCHTPKNWIVNNIKEIHEENGFALNGAHGNLDCATCHTSETNLRFDRIGNDCINCHLTDFNNTINPDHKSAEFSTNCSECHNAFSTSWSPAVFNHEMFPLTLGHQIEECKLCHVDNNFKDTSPDCVSCHQTDFNSSQDPNHEDAGFSTDCVTCHTTNPSWNPTTWDHNEFYPLNGAHAAISNDCTACHKPKYGTYSNTPNTCAGCHIDDFNATTAPNHSVSNFPTDCATCHTENSWEPSNFNHDFFPLSQGHDIDDCTQCHTTANYADTSPDCVSCHQSDYDTTINPNHVGAQFSTDCIACHTPGGWTPSTFDHNFFPLTLGHDIQDCSQCHISASYSDTSPDCVTCHLSTYNATTNPNHTSVGFNIDCATCHTTGAWTPSTFDHNFFPLTLGHDIQDCTQCHTTGNYADASSDCVTCHQSTYNATTNPNHTSAGFNTDCATCHTTGGWTPATFDHEPFFPITSGKHSGFQCIECHTVANNYSVFSCITCHEHSNKADVDDDHSGESGYTYESIACYNCHPAGRE